MENNRIKTRVFYEKRGRAKYISHLDINRLMQRVLKRAGLPVWYTEGFNPHMYLTFALPLSLGYESVYECMDFHLTREMDFAEVKQILNDNLPEGLRVNDVAAPVHKIAEIAAADYAISLAADCPAEELLRDFREFLDTDTIEVVKKTKRGEHTVNIRPDLALLALDSTEDAVVCRMRFPAGSEKNYNPSLLLDAFTAQTGIALTRCAVLRTDVYCKDGSSFR